MEEEHFSATVEPPQPTISVDEGCGPVTVTSRVVALHELKFKCSCSCCSAELSFGVQHIHKVCSTWSAWFWQTPDSYQVKCPVCYGMVSVKASLPTWVLKRI